MAELPPASELVRAALDRRARALGWPALHAELAAVDAIAAARIHPNDAQRIQRALEVYQISGRPISAWQSLMTPPPEEFRWLRFALVPADRAALGRALEERFSSMLEAGLVAEVSALFHRGDLHAELPSIRSVGYRQLWAYCGGRIALDEASRLAVTATRQLAKRQLTWLRGEAGYECLDPADISGLTRIVESVGQAGFVAAPARGC
jgi:tRNA dimethylallyltransferase